MVCTRILLSDLNKSRDDWIHNVEYFAKDKKKRLTLINSIHAREKKEHMEMEKQKKKEQMERTKLAKKEQMEKVKLEKEEQMEQAKKSRPKQLVFRN